MKGVGKGCPCSIKYRMTFCFSLQGLFLGTNSFWTSFKQKISLFLLKKLFFCFLYSKNIFQTWMSPIKRCNKLWILDLAKHVWVWLPRRFSSFLKFSQLTLIDDLFLSLFFKGHIFAQTRSFMVRDSKSLETLL